MSIQMQVSELERQILLDARTQLASMANFNAGINAAASVLKDAMARAEKTGRSDLAESFKAAVAIIEAKKLTRGSVPFSLDA